MYLEHKQKLTWSCVLTQQECCFKDTAWRPQSWSSEPWKTVLFVLGTFVQLRIINFQIQRLYKLGWIKVMKNVFHFLLWLTIVNRASLVVSGWGVTLQHRGHQFDSWSGKIPHAVKQLSLCATVTESELWSVCSATTDATARVAPASCSQGKPARQQRRPAQPKPAN